MKKSSKKLVRTCLSVFDTMQEIQNLIVDLQNKNINLVDVKLNTIAEYDCDGHINAEYLYAEYPEIISK